MNTRIKINVNQIFIRCRKDNLKVSRILNLNCVPAGSQEKLHTTLGQLENAKSNFHFNLKNGVIVLL